MVNGLLSGLLQETASSLGWLLAGIVIGVIAMMPLALRGYEWRS